MSPTNPYVETLTANMAVLEDRTFKKQLRLNEVIRMGPNPMGLATSKKRKRSKKCVLTEE